jgi:hypothetical protein
VVSVRSAVPIKAKWLSTTITLPAWSEVRYAKDAIRKLGRFESLTVTWMEKAVEFLRTDQAQLALKFVKEHYDRQIEPYRDELRRLENEEWILREKLQKHEARKREIMALDNRRHHRPRQ